MTTTSPNTDKQIAIWQELKAQKEALRSRYQENIVSLGNVLEDLSRDDPHGFYDRQTMQWLLLQIEHCDRAIARYAGLIER